jgi:hypothetical protein
MMEAIQRGFDRNLMVFDDNTKSTWHFEHLIFTMVHVYESQAENYALETQATVGKPNRIFLPNDLFMPPQYFPGSIRGNEFTTENITFSDGIELYGCRLIRDRRLSEGGHLNEWYRDHLGGTFPANNPSLIVILDCNDNPLLGAC